MKAWVVIPAYNEAKALRVLLAEVKKESVSILVVDDGSTDDTYQVARAFASEVIQNQTNQGKGMSLNKAISYLLKNEDFDYLVTMDADGQHSPEDLKLFLAAAASGADFVVGNRMADPKGMPKLRVLTNKYMSWLISKAAGQDIPDTQCGFRLIKKAILEKIIIRTNKFEIESEIIIKAARLGSKIKSIPIRSIYFKHQRSNIHPFFDGIRFFRFISKSKCL
jgi:glycosyltransferase involved in cell wall biosynthesis